MQLQDLLGSAGGLGAVIVPIVATYIAWKIAKKLLYAVVIVALIPMVMTVLGGPEAITGPLQAAGAPEQATDLINTLLSAVPSINLLDNIL